MINIKNHPFITQASDMQELSKPLYALGISNFVFHKNYLNGAEIRLSNNPAWIAHFYEKQYYRFSAFEKHPSELQTGFVLWSHLQNHSPVLSAAREFNIDHGITLVKRVQDGVEFFFFGTTPDNQKIINFYVNNLDLLDRYTVFFKESAHKLIKKAETKKIVIPNKFSMVSDISDQGNACLIANTQRERFILDTPIKNIHIADNYNTRLSRRELDCVAELLQGKTLKEISNSLAISIRTVETHVNNLKEKLQCRTKSELIRYLIQHGFDKQSSYL